VVENAKYDNNWLEKWIEKRNSERIRLEEKLKKEAERKAKSDLRKLSQKGVKKIKKYK
jgi:single-stranded DNA-specific DHH superfamily exonuclease